MALARSRKRSRSRARHYRGHGQYIDTGATAMTLEVQLSRDDPRLADVALCNATNESALERLIPLVTNSVRSPHSKIAYARGLRDFLTFVRRKAANPEFNRALVQEYRTILEMQGKRPSSVNQALSAIRKLAAEAADGGYLDPGK